MFGYCVWLEFIKNHHFYSIHKTIACALRAQTHNPHITLDYNVLKNNGIEKTKCYNPTTLYACGKVYQDNTSNFYALQQNYIRENDSSQIFHVSLAYRVDEKFTKEEIQFANSLNIPRIIKPEEFNVTLWNCDSIYTKDWYNANILNM